MPDDYADLIRGVVGSNPSERVRRIAQQAQIPPDIAEDYLKTTQIESGHNINVRPSSKGALGFGQVMPDVKGGTFRTVGGRRYNLKNPDENIEAGLRYFAEGGNDPVARRLYYFGGPRARAHYERTGRIPNISDANMTAAQYVRATGGQQQQPSPAPDDDYSKLIREAVGRQQTPQQTPQPVQPRAARPVPSWGKGPIGRGVKPVSIAPRGISAARVEGEARPSEATATRGALRNIAASAGLPTGIPSAAGDLINEAVYQGAGQLLNAAGGVGTSRLAVSPITSATEYLANRAGISPSRILKQGARQIAGNVQAVDEEANRGVISSTAKDLIAGSIGSSPAMILTALGVPAPVAFGLQSNLEAEGSDASFKDVVKETAKGATIGALFELPLPVKQELLTTLQQRLLRAGIVGSGTAALTGSPTESLINAAFGATGGKGRERTTETRPETAPVAEPLPEAPQAAAPEVAAVTHPKLQRRLDDGTYGKETKAETEARRAQVESASATPKPAPEELIRPPEAAVSPAELPPEAAQRTTATTAPIPEKQGERGAIDVDLLTLGARPFAQEVAGKAVEGARGVRDLQDGLRKILAPATRGPEARETALAMRAHGGEMERQRVIAERSLRDARNAFSRQKPESNYEFIDRMETGKPQPDPKQQAFADTIREQLDNRRDQIRALGTGKLENFIENYFPHIWKDPVKARDAFAQVFSRRPLEGSKAFLKQRTLPLTRDGLDLGLKPVSSNPVDLAILKLREMDKYLMAHRVIGELKENNLLKFFKVSERLPEGYAQINDKVATVFSRGEKGELVLRGRYAAPEPVARVINNYLSPGLESTALRAPYKAWRATANALNQFQLGFSAFHAGFTTLDAAISRTAAGIEDIVRYGKPLRGARTILSTPISPITNLIQGSKMLQEYYRPGSQGGEIAKYVDALVKGGGRAEQGRMYTNRAIRGFTDALKQGNIIGSVFRAPGAAVEAIAKPTMEYLVPRQKLGVFAEMAKRELERLGPNASQQEVRQAMSKAWDSVDNRMGQMVYDNLFWNKMAKDLAMSSVRSVGWNLGTLREVGGGIIDYATLPKRALQRQRVDPLFTHRMAYATALPLVVGAMGAITQYLLTGKGPEELKDYYFPKTGKKDEQGNPERIAFPSYMKDIFHMREEPGKVVTSKLHPLIGVIGDMLRNEDYYGVEIRNANDPLVQQLKDTAKYVGTALTPFAVRGYQKEKERGVSPVRRVLPFVGVTPAPSYINKTEAQKLATKIQGERLPDQALTKEQAATRQLRSSLLRRARSGEDVEDDLDKAVQSGQLSMRQVKDIGRNAKLTPLAVQVKYLPLNDALRVWDKASAKEREDLQPIVSKKAGTALGQLRGQARTDMQAQLDKRGIKPLSRTKGTLDLGIPKLSLPRLNLQP